MKTGAHLVKKHLIKDSTSLKPFSGSWPVIVLAKTLCKGSGKTGYLDQSVTYNLQFEQSFTHIWKVSITYIFQGMLIQTIRITWVQWLIGACVYSVSIDTGEKAWSCLIYSKSRITSLKTISLLRLELRAILLLAKIDREIVRKGLKNRIKGDACRSIIFHQKMILEIV